MSSATHVVLVLSIGCGPAASPNVNDSSSEDVTSHADGATEASATSSSTTTSVETTASSTSVESTDGAEATASGSTTGGFESCEEGWWQTTASHGVFYGDWPGPGPMGWDIDAQCTVVEYQHLSCLDDRSQSHELALDLLNLPAIDLDLELGEAVHLLHRAVEPSTWTVIRDAMGGIVFIGINANELAMADHADAYTPFSLEIAAGLCRPEPQGCGTVEPAAVSVSVGDASEQMFSHQTKLLAAELGMFTLQSEYVRYYADAEACGTDALLVDVVVARSP